MNAAALLYTSVCFSVSVASTLANSACRKLKPRLTYFPLAFISIASISRKPTPRFFIALMKLSASPNGVPSPQKPSLCMYAMLPISLMPVAEQYTTLASGHRLCSSMTHAATLLPVSAPASKFLALWHSSSRTHPSAASPPNHSKICSSRDPRWFRETRVAYVRNRTPSRKSLGNPNARLPSRSSSWHPLMTFR